jgi:hypothetical protein
MLCGRCEARFADTGSSHALSFPARRRGEQRLLGGLLCAECGIVLPGEEIALLLLQKQSQLAQFGLAAAAQPLLELTNRKD